MLFFISVYCNSAVDGKTRIPFNAHTHVVQASVVVAVDDVLRHFKMCNFMSCNFDSVPRNTVRKERVTYLCAITDFAVSLTLQIMARAGQQKQTMHPPSALRRSGKAE